MANAVSDLTSLKPLEETLAQKRQAREQAFKPMQESLTAKGEVEAAEKKMLAGATAQREADITAEQERYAKRVAEAPQREEKKKISDELAKPFIPSQENMQDMAGLFALINVVGFALGRGGKQNAMNAMSAMNGMLEGHQKGREDLYKKEKGQFELNLKRLKQQMDTLDSQLKDAIQTYATDRDAGIQKARTAFAQAGADFYKEYEQKYGLAALYEFHKQNYAAAGKAEETAEKIYRDARREAAVERRHQESMSLRRDIAEMGQKGRGSALNSRYAFNINESFSQAAVDLLNVSQMPGNTVLGAFAGMTGQSGDTLTKSLSNVLARKLTPEDQRLMQQIVAGLDQNMARALGGGYATSTSKGLIQAYKEQVAQMGDSPLAQAMFLSRMKQELGILAKAFRNHPGANEGYVEDMREYMSELNKAIPFQVSDVVAATRGKKGTITDKFSNLAQQPTKLALPAEGGSVTETAKPDVTEKTPSVDVDKERSRAKAAIAAGKDEAAVKARFKERTGQEL